MSAGHEHQPPAVGPLKKYLQKPSSTWWINMCSLERVWSISKCEILTVMSKEKKKKKKEGKFKVSHLQISQTKITRTSWLSFSRYFPPLIGSEWLKKTRRVTTRFITGESFIGLSHFWTPNKIHKLTPLRMLLSAELPRDKVQTPTRVFVKEGKRQRLSLPLTYDVQAGERSADRTCL